MDNITLFQAATFVQISKDTNQTKRCNEHRRSFSPNS